MTHTGRVSEEHKHIYVFVSCAAAHDAGAHAPDHPRAVRAHTIARTRAHATARRPAVRVRTHACAAGTRCARECYARSAWRYTRTRGARMTYIVCVVLFQGPFPALSLPLMLLMTTVLYWY